MARARDQVRGPATALLVVGVINWILSSAGCLWLIVSGVMSGRSVSDPAMACLLAALVIVINGFTVHAAMSMKRLENWTAAVVASFLVMVISPANLLGLPIGIWALIVLCLPHVRAAFGVLGDEDARGRRPTIPARVVVALRVVTAAWGVAIIGREALWAIVTGTVEPSLAVSLLVGGGALIGAAIPGPWKALGRRPLLSRPVATLGLSLALVLWLAAIWSVAGPRIFGWNAFNLSWPGWAVWRVLGFHQSAAFPVLGAGRMGLDCVWLLGPMLWLTIVTAHSRFAARPVAAMPEAGPAHTAPAA